MGTVQEAQLQNDIDMADRLNHARVNHCVTVTPDRSLGGLAYPSFAEVQRIAGHCLKLFDQNPKSPGAQHAQSQRFLNPRWQGLRPESNDPSKDPALRLLMESIACGETTLADYVNDESPEAVSLHSVMLWPQICVHCHKTVSVVTTRSCFVSK